MSAKKRTQSVILPQRVHLFPFRTQKLSSAEPKILAWRRAGKIGHCRHRTYVQKQLSLYRFSCLLISYSTCRLSKEEYERSEYSSLAHVDSTQQAELLPTSHKEKYKYSSLAQSVEHMTVNHGVVGSSPTGGAKTKARGICLGLLFCLPLLRPPPTPHCKALLCERSLVRAL